MQLQIFESCSHGKVSLRQQAFLRILTHHCNPKVLKPELPHVCASSSSYSAFNPLLILSCILLSLLFFIASTPLSVSNM